MKPSLSLAYQLMGPLTEERVEQIKDLVQKYKFACAARDCAMSPRDLAAAHKKVLEARQTFAEMVAQTLIERQNLF